jgi:spermidine/putrescine-binding protein
MAIDALAEPRDAPHPKEAAALIDFLLRPAVAAEAAAAAGLASAEAAAPADNFRALWPVGVYDPKLVPIIEKEWARTRAPEQPANKPQGKPQTKPTSKPASRPANKPTAKPTRTKR